MLRATIFRAVLVWLVLFSPALAANYTLEIIQPQEGLTTANRFYKAYPGLIYNVNIAVIGGAYPFTYALNEPATTCNDNGQAITLNDSTGELSWTPQVADNGCTMSVTVTDQESATDTHVWTVAVTASGFLFISYAGAGNESGDSAANAMPFDTMYGGAQTPTSYEAKADSTYSGVFIYLLDTAVYNLESTYIYLETSVHDRFPFGQAKPAVWLPYPGDTPTFEMSGGYIIIEGATNYYFDGIHFTGLTNGKREALRPGSGGNDFTVRNCDFTGATASIDGATNMANIFIYSGGVGLRWAIIGSNFHDNVDSMGIEGYDATKVLVANNTFYNFDNEGANECHAIGPKLGYSRWDIRANTLWNNDSFSIWLDGYSGSTQAAGESEVRFNNVYSVASGYAFHSQYDTGVIRMDPVYIYRNTFVGTVTVRNAQTGDGPWTFFNNVIQNAGGITCSNCTDSSTIIEGTGATANLEGTEGLVGATGLLVNRDYVGTYGWEIAEAAQQSQGSSMSGTGSLGMGGTGAMSME